MKKIYFRYSIYLLLVLAFCMMPLMSWALGLKHYTGVAGDGTFNWNGTQKCHEQVYYLYAQPGQRIDLDLPLENYTGLGQNFEPRGYFRWYNWEQDGLRDGYNRLSKYGSSTTQLEDFTDGSGFYFCNSSANPLKYQGPRIITVGTQFVAPSGADYAAWQADTIACDVSRYTDFVISEEQNQIQEPTISIRYKFIIRPAQWIATQLREAVVNSNIYTRTFEDGKFVTVSIKGTGSGESESMFRLNYPRIGRYFFYPLTADAWDKKNIFYADADKAKNKFEESDFESTLVQAKGCIWVVYDDSYQYYCTVPAETDKCYFCKISPYILNNRTWSRVADKTEVGKPGADADGKLKAFQSNSRFYIVAYLANSKEASDKYCPVANFTCRFVSDYPRTYASLDKDAVYRTLDYLSEHYSLATDPISFDNSSADMTLALPTVENNMAQKPSKWDLRHYGFVYRQLKDYLSLDGQSVGALAKFGGIPLHGEYGLYKTVGVSGISASSTTAAPTDYSWYVNKPLYDRTYALTGGTQSGYFLYVDASDESRPIASANFDAKLCTGSTIVISAAVADLTNGATKPQVVFKLYGVGDDGVAKQENLIHSFASGDFKTIGATTTSVWYQVYARVTLRKGAGVERFSKFKVTIDNYCPSTSGADYAIDDIRLYKADAIVNVIQQKPVCEDAAVVDGMQLKLRASFASLNAKVSETSTGEAPIYYRVIDEEGNALDIDYGNGDKKYGKVLFHTNIADCDAAEIEHVNNEDYFVIANRDFALQLGKNYYVVLAFDNPEEETGWGNPQSVCSAYSDKFSLVKQGVVVKDANSKVTATYRVGCGSDKPKVTINAQLQTTDQLVGGTVTLPTINFDWFFGTKEEFLQTKLLQALHALRAIKPNDPVNYTATITNLKNAGQLSEEYANEILKYMNNGKLKMPTAGTVCPAFSFSLGKNSVTVLPRVGTNNELDVNGVKFTICPDPMEYDFTIYKDGPKINLGFHQVTYASSDDKAVRIGLPQLRDMAAHTPAKGDATQQEGGFLYLPLHSTNAIANTQGSAIFEFNAEGYDNQVILSGSNDPSVQQLIGKQAYFLFRDADLKYQAAETEQRYLALQLADGVEVDKLFHEGYTYEFTFMFTQQSTDGAYVSCPGTTDFTVKVVPEYLTWKPTADGGNNNNWNNDLNWCRSARRDLYKGDGYPAYGETEGYEDLTVQQAFVPMKFCKVTVLGPQYTIGYYPLMGYLQRGANGLLNKLTNGASTATANIQYDMVADDENLPAEAAGEGNYVCIPFYGNTCDEIYFKPDAEIRNQQYLIYNKAWVEKEMQPNTWYVLTSPLKDTYAGDMYVPMVGGRQETEAFQPILFSDADNNRIKSPVYQRSWDAQGAEETSLEGNYAAYDLSGTGTDFDKQTLYGVSSHWSHVYNQLNKAYTPMEGFALKMGDKYTVSGSGSASGTGSASGSSASSDMLLRLPKADTHYDYYASSSSASGLSHGVDVSKEDENRFVVPTDAKEDANGSMSYELPALSDDNAYYLVGNPYMATLSMYKFFKANPGLESLFYTYVDGQIKFYDSVDLSLSTYDSENDVTIAPMQSFFVRVADGKQLSKLQFTSSMTIDREMHTATTIPLRAKYVLTPVRSASTDINEIPKDAATSQDGMLEIYTLDGKLVSRPSAPASVENPLHLPSGIYIIKQHQKVVKKVLIP